MFLILLIPTILFAQTKGTITIHKPTKVDSLVGKLEPWDYGYHSRYAPTIIDTIMWKLIDMGKPIAKQLFPYLDSTEKVISIHIILSVIYGEPVESEEQTISETKTTIINQREINGLLYTREKSSEGIEKFTIDKSTQVKIKEKWRKKIQ